MPRLFLYVSLLMLLACGDSPQPKPNGFLALNYEKASYTKSNLDCPFRFEVNTQSRLEKKASKPCWITIHYPKMNAKIYLTYTPIQNNLKALLHDAQKLPEKHSIKADRIDASVYENVSKCTYGNFYKVEGDAASQAQFYLTDSTSHFLTGSVYFDAIPHYDSILPAADYLQNDMKHLIETLEWK